MGGFSVSQEFVTNNNGGVRSLIIPYLIGAGRIPFLPPFPIELLSWLNLYFSQIVALCIRQSSQPTLEVLTAYGNSSSG